MHVDLTEKEVLYLIMACDAMRAKRPATYRRHISVATMARLKLTHSMDGEKAAK